MTTVDFDIEADIDVVVDIDVDVVVGGDNTPRWIRTRVEMATSAETSAANDDLCLHRGGLRLPRPRPAA